MPLLHRCIALLLVGLLLAGLLLSVTPLPTQASPTLSPDSTVAWLIEPGVGVGPLRLMTTPGKRLLYELSEGRSQDAFKTFGVQLTRRPFDRTVVAITVTAPCRAQTPEGIGVGGSVAQVRKHHPRAATFKADKTLWMVDYEQRIAWHFTAASAAPQIDRIVLWAWREQRFAPTHQSETTEKLQVLPGSGIGNLLIKRDGRTELLAMFGAPDVVTRLRTATRFVFRGRGVIAYIDNTNNRLAHMTLVSPFRGRTDNGIAIGSDAASVTKTLGEGDFHLAFRRYRDRGADIYLRDGRVVGIELYAGASNQPPPLKTPGKTGH